MLEQPEPFSRQSVSKQPNLKYPTIDQRFHSEVQLYHSGSVLRGSGRIITEAPKRYQLFSNVANDFDRVSP